MRESRRFAIICVILVMIALGVFGSKVALFFTARQGTSLDTQIGSDFTLTDQNGGQVTQETLKGKFSLVFFGFTHCPMLCPTALATITTALDALPAEVSRQIIPVFITLDPQRDDVATLKEYAHHFHPSLLALTGAPDEIKKMANAYKVYYHANTDKPEQKDYAVDHSGYLYLMDRQGHYLKIFSYDVTPDELKNTLRATVGTAGN